MKFNRLSRIIASAAILLGLAVPVAHVFAAGPNLISNPSAETAVSGAPSGWLQGSWGTLTPAFSYTSSGAQDGTHALSLSVTGYSSGDAKWYFAPVAITGGTAYTFGDYYQSSVATQLVVQTDDGAGNYSYTNPVALAASSTWKAATLSFTAPAGAKNATVFHVIAANGTLTTDNFSLAAASAISPTPTLTPVPTASPTPAGTPAPTTTPAPSGNLVANPSFETAAGTLPQSWTSDAWGTNTPKFTYQTTGHTGTRSANVQLTSYSSGDAKWMFAPVAVTPGQTYNFSDYYLSNVETEIDAAYTMTNGTTQYVYFGTLGASTAWAQYKKSFTVPAGVKSVTVFHILYKVGSLSTDDYSLTSGSTATPTPTPSVTPTPTPTPAPTATPNPTATGIPNPSVETASGTQPAGWTQAKWGTNTSTFSYLNTGHTGTHSLKLTVANYTDGTADWEYAPQAVTAGTRYVYSDWYQATAASEVDIAVLMSDGTTHIFYVGSAAAASTWTHSRFEYVMPAGAVKANVIHLMYQNGSLTTDDFSFVPYVASSLNRAIVTLTFDDGWATHYTSGLPTLNKYGLKGTFYIVSSFLNTAGYMTPAQVSALKSAGNQIGSHTVTHPDLTTLSATNLNNELKNSQTSLVNLFGGPISDFANPYGAYNNTTVSAVQTYYRSQRTTDTGYNGKSDTDMYRLRVQNITSTTTPAEVQGWVNQAIKDKTWLIIVYHQIDNSGDTYSVTPANFDKEMSALKASGAAVETMTQAIAEVSPQLTK